MKVEVVKRLLNLDDMKLMYPTPGNIVLRCSLEFKGRRLR